MTSPADIVALNCEAQQSGESLVHPGRRTDSSSSDETSHRSGKVEGKDADAVHQHFVPLEDATAQLQMKLDQLEARLDKLQEYSKAEVQYKGQVLAELFRGQLIVLNSGTNQYLQELDRAERGSLEAKLGRPLRSTDDYYTLVKAPGALQHDGANLDRALQAGEARFHQAYEGAKAALLQKQGLQAFPQEIPASTMRRLFRGPVSHHLSSHDEHRHPLIKRGRSFISANLLRDLKERIENGDPLFSESPDWDELVLLGVTMGQACIKKFSAFKISDYELL